MKKICNTLLIAVFFVISFSTHIHTSTKLPIVYHKKHNITFFGLTKLITVHAFNGEKYKEIYHKLCKKTPSTFRKGPVQPLVPNLEFYTTSGQISEKRLADVHTPEYLQDLYTSRTIAHIVEIFPLAFVPNFILRKGLLEPMKYATQGTLDAYHLAMKHGRAINLGGGYHHAKANKGEGFCVYSDIALAIKQFQKDHPDKKTMIIDLDAHQGNGHESIFLNDDSVVIYDAYNQNVYPRDIEAQKKIAYETAYNASYYAITDDIYLQRLDETLEQAIKKEQPNFLVYVAGSDILNTDPLGHFQVSKQGIIQRDEKVFAVAHKYNIPILMLLAGGYTKESSEVVAESIINIAKTLSNEKATPKSATSSTRSE